MKPELPLKGGWEYDALTGLRHNLCVFANHHARARDMKRKYNKRVRKHVKMMILRGIE